MAPKPAAHNRKAPAPTSAPIAESNAIAPHSRQTSERPIMQPIAESSQVSAPVNDPAKKKKKKKKHKAGKRHRRQSFAATSDIPETEDSAAEALPLVDPDAVTRSSFYRLHGGNESNTSITSEALLDHRDSGPLQTRRQSIQQNLLSPRTSGYGSRGYLAPPPSATKSKLSRAHRISDTEHEEEEDADDRTPLMSSSHRQAIGEVYGSFGRDSRRSSFSSNSRTNKPKLGLSRSATSIPASAQLSGSNLLLDYDVNNPPSVPGSPLLGADMGYDDVMLTGDMSIGKSDGRKSPRPALRDALINIDDGVSVQCYDDSQVGSPKTSPQEGRRLNLAEIDVCFPQEGMSEIGQEDVAARGQGYSRPRRRRRLWPDFSVLEEWSSEEKEQRTMEGIRARKVSEPLMVGGRLRPQKRVWHREDEDAPYRFTYFNEEFQSTVHSQTISELLQPGQTFRDLFIPEPPLLSDSSSDEDEDDAGSKFENPFNGHTTRTSTRQSSRVGENMGGDHSGEQTGTNTPTPAPVPNNRDRPKLPRYGPRPVFWLDVLSPTDAEMRVISKAFGIHPLTAEDIMMQEAREKVELFRHYYFVNYRSFEQDMNSEDYLEPVNMYVVVFREGVISFHFSLTPHPANVRRRIRQLSDYLILSSDWISYAIIDDITDVYAPLIERIEEEVDDIDDTILQLHSDIANGANKENKDDEKTAPTASERGSDMLRRVGECRKKVMSLYRLLGNKADVIKGFAKRCNEQWDVAPRSEIGLYLGDIQDHIVTMTGNLSHYENLLSRAHSNYLAQINMLMNERQEQTADVLGKLTVLGTIVLPMNIVTGLWGMNVLVPGQDVENLYWFFSLTAGLLVFGLGCYFIAKRVYGIV